MKNFISKIKAFFIMIFFAVFNAIKSFFYRGNDFQPVYFWVTVLMGLICHDPYGDAKGSYVNQDGQAVEYPKEFLRKYTGEKIRCIYWIR